MLCLPGPYAQALVVVLQIDNFWIYDFTRSGGRLPKIDAIIFGETNVTVQYTVS